jgi:hypothetical protein
MRPGPDKRILTRRDQSIEVRGDEPRRQHFAEELALLASTRRASHSEFRSCGFVAGCPRCPGGTRPESCSESPQDFAGESGDSLPRIGSANRGGGGTLQKTLAFIPISSMCEWKPRAADNGTVAKR